MKLNLNYCYVVEHIRLRLSRSVMHKHGASLVCGCWRLPTSVFDRYEYID